MDLLHQTLLLLLAAQAVPQLLSHIQARLLSQVGPAVGCLQVSLEPGNNLLQAGGFAFQCARPPLQVLHQTCQLSLCSTPTSLLLDQLLHPNAMHCALADTAPAAKCYFLSGLAALLSCQEVNFES